MQVVGHQDVGVQCAAFTLQRFAQPAKIGEPVLVSEEARPPIVPPLDDVKRQAVDMDAWAAGHAASLAEIEPGPFFPFSPALDDLADLPLERYAHTLLLPRIWDYRGNLTAYDATYLALADALDCPVWTRDARFAKAPPAIGRVQLI
jgi:hypothetical protein